MGLKYCLLIIFIHTRLITGATTTTILEPYESNSFECSAEGSFADPNDCKKYHVCQLMSTGEFWDIPLTCPDTTVWCQRSQQCENPVTCPCQIDISTTTTTTTEEPIPENKPRTCLEIQTTYDDDGVERNNNFERKLNSSWSYEIFPFGPTNPPVSVRCDFDTEGGGWTIIQQRVPGENQYDFLKNWTDYEQGFGSTENSYWLGLKAIHALTSATHQSLRVDLGDWDGNFRFANYDLIFVSSPSDLYRLLVSGYSGNAGDSMESHNQMNFSTVDRDNDNSTNTNCAAAYNGSWWFNNCFMSDLNGPYLGKEEADTYKGIRWASWKDHSFQTASMKIRDLIFSP